MNKMILVSMPRLIVMLVLFSASRVMAIDDGLARTPPMGWNSWNQYQLNINEELIRATADAIATNGMKTVGYQYIVVDAGWKARQRDEKGRLVADPNKFPSGMKALANYVHSRGLKFGIYTDAGAQDCVAGTPGSKDFETLDAATFAEWGVNYLKEDWCNTDGMNAKAVYTKMHDALVATGQPVIFSICEWGDNRPWEWAPAIAHSWRTTGDIKDCWDCGRETMNKPGGFPRGWTLILDAQPALKNFAGPGHWNDPDMLVVGLPGQTADEVRAHFSLWCILAAPLVCGCRITSMSPEVANILLNPEVIAVDQDPLGIQGDRVFKDKDSEIWMKPLQDQCQAVVLFNRSDKNASITAPFETLNLAPTNAVMIRDLWRRREIGQFTNSFNAIVPAHGVVMFKICPAENQK